MRQLWFIIFFSIVLLVYALVNYYIIRRGLQVLPGGSSLRVYLVVLVSFFAVSFLAGRFLERVSVNWMTASLIWIGSFWLAIMVYLLMQLAIIDLVRVLNHLIGFISGGLKANMSGIKEITAVTVLSITFLVVVLGHVNTWFPEIRQFSLSVNKTGDRLRELHIVALSDIHLGTTIEKRHLGIIVDKVNELKPDIILLPGDIIDEDIRPVIHNRVGEVLKKFSAKYGVYAVTGNHEYIGGVDLAKKYLAEHQVTLLNDTSVLIDDSFYIVGREDLSIKQFSGKQRKQLKDIVEGIDHTKPIILLDHQPFKLEEATKNGIDLQLSGHTHHGQLWPFNYITNMIFEVSWGYKKKGNTHYYVSSGVGGWGPPIRTVNRPEIVSIKLQFNQ